MLIHDSGGHAACILCLAYVAEKHRATLTQVCPARECRVRSLWQVSPPSPPHLTAPCTIASVKPRGPPSDMPCRQVSKWALDLGQDTRAHRGLKLWLEAALSRAPVPAAGEL